MINPIAIDDVWQSSRNTTENLIITFSTIFLRELLCSDPGLTAAISPSSEVGAKKFHPQAIFFFLAALADSGKLPKDLSDLIFVSRGLTYVQYVGVRNDLEKRKHEHLETLERSFICETIETRENTIHKCNISIFLCKKIINC